MECVLQKKVAPWHLLAAAILAAVSMLPVGCQKPDPAAANQPPQRPLNVLLITVDTLRADRLGCYGYDKNTTPAIDSVARQGTLFLNVMAPRGLTVPSLATIMTGQYPVAHGVRGNSYKLPEENTYLAEILRENGYACGAFLANELTWGKNWEGFEHIAKGDDETVVNDALGWMEKKSGGPFFSWLLLYAPHRPFTPPVEYGRRFDPAYTEVADGEAQDYELNGVTLAQQDLPQQKLQSVQALYDAEVAYTDALISRLLDWLKQKGLEDNTLVIITADHGEELYDHFKYFYHFASMYGSALHVPLILRLPNVIPRTARVPQIVENLRIAPTILGALVIQPPPTFQGDSLMPLAMGKHEAERPAVAEYEDQMLTIRVKDYRLIYNPQERHVMWINEAERHGRQGYAHLEYKPVELYDLRADPLEQTNIAAQRPELVKSLVGTLQVWQKKYGWEFGAKDVSIIDQSLKEQMESLGYLPGG
ncbi:MAG TPA: sulfatase [Candidatus Bathyarchaeia archaeon]|nr:sulfatase [Candidatus Bathyarchaeia archaeon]